MLTDTETITEITYAGGFSPGTLIAAGVVAAVVIVLLTFTENRPVRFGVLSVVSLLRIAAVAVVLWALAGLSIRTEMHTAQHPSLAVVTDVSASMSVADPLPTAGPDAREVRWAVGQADPLLASMLADLDGAAARLGWAERVLARLARNRPDAETAVNRDDELENVSTQVRSAADQLDRVLSDATVDPAGLRGRVAAIRSFLLDEVVEQITALNRSASAWREDTHASRQARLDETHRLLADQADRLAGVADELALHLAHEEKPAAAKTWRAWVERPRSEKVAAWTGDAHEGWLADLPGRADVRRYHFADHVWPAPAETHAAEPAGEIAATDGIDPTRLETNLAEVLRQLAADALAHRVRAAFLFTDGAHNAASDPVEAAAHLVSTPLFIVPVGRSDPIRDAVVHHAQAPATVFENDVALVEAMLDAYDLAGHPVTVDFECNDTLIESRTLVPNTNAYVARLRFEHKPGALGTCRYAVRARPLPDESILDNNAARLDVEVIESRLNVLLVDRLPRWEFRFLCNLFKRDPRVEAEAALLDEPRAQVGWTALGLPDELQQWQTFRVVILGDVDPHDLNVERQAALAAYVRQGGTLVVIAGEEAMPAAYRGQPLERILPVELCAVPPAAAEGYHPFITSAGRETPVTRLEADEDASQRLWREQIVIHELSPWACPRPTAHMLIACVPPSASDVGADAPALVSWHFYGRGRVIYLAAPVTYQLRQRFGDRYHHRFWGQLLRWAVARQTAGGGRTVLVSTDKNQYAHDEPVRVAVRLADLDRKPIPAAEITVDATQDGRPVGRVELHEDNTEAGLYVGTLHALPAGTITLTAAGPQVAALLAAEQDKSPAQTLIQVEPALHAELRHTQCDLALLSRLAETAGGLVVPPTALESLVANLDMTPEVTVSHETRPAWNRWWVLWLVVGCLSAEWVTRKLAGLA